MENVIMAKKGLKVKLKSDESIVLITHVCENSAIIYEYKKNNSGTDDGGACRDEYFIGLNGETIRHPNYFKNNN
jgi:hypothetical protein